ncbi:thiamine pyrophosphate-binding protein [Blastococcus brunescens]|uniref:Thiamine pyrophosphate-binding protein n=1 Tax=Blastococcus brunescens TaxID=1564165 RepID=A0ABZ1AYB8_9ACTN|nr:thiamine pyrophosphate-binding protein [Blastococcus sp. BMG 8361]WRL63568.1 thiamine pyrophosphate-binding protein [Blastococcus sp. BMG 8361]
MPYITLNPGASFRGLHDSLVNHLGNQQPEMLVCLHEEHAVAIAHGYAKVTGEPSASCSTATWGSCTPRWRSSTASATECPCC